MAPPPTTEPGKSFLASIPEAPAIREKNARMVALSDLLRLLENQVEREGRFGSADLAGQAVLERQTAARWFQPIVAGDIPATFSANVFLLRECFQSFEKEGDPELSVRFAIGDDGRVTSAAVAPSSTNKNRSLQKCVLDAVRTFRFRQTGGRTTLTYPFVFHRRR
jgi:TonB family protein